MIGDEGHGIGQGGCVENGEECPSPLAAFIFDGHDGGNAGKIEQHENKIGERCGWRERAEQHLLQARVFVVALAFGLHAGIHHAQGAHHELFGPHAGEDAKAHFPVEAQGLHDGFDGLSHTAYIRVGLLLLQGGTFRRAGVVAEEPDDNGAGQDDAGHFF